MNYLRTGMLLAGLTALFMGVGFLVGGESGAMIALVVAAGMNLISYWNADKLVLSMHGAQEVDRSTAPALVDLVGELAGRAGRASLSWTIRSRMRSPPAVIRGTPRSPSPRA